MDIYKALKQDHEEVKKMLEKLSESTERAVKTRQATFQKLKAELIAHSRAEEEVLYTALREHEETRDNALEGGEEHHLVDILLQELTELDVSDEHWTAKITVLKEMIEHHVEEEEGEVFKTAKKLFSDEEARAMGEAFQQHKKQHQPKAA